MVISYYYDSIMAIALISKDPQVSLLKIFYGNNIMSWDSCKQHLDQFQDLNYSIINYLFMEIISISMNNFSLNFFHNQMDFKQEVVNFLKMLIIQKMLGLSPILCSKQMNFVDYFYLVLLLLVLQSYLSKLKLEQHNKVYIYTN